MENKNLENENVTTVEETPDVVAVEDTEAVNAIVEAATEEEITETGSAAEENAAETDISADEASAAPVKDLEKSNKKEKSSNMDCNDSKPAKKKFAFTGLLAVILICAILWVAYSGIFANKYPTIYNTSKVSALYIKDNSIKYHKASGKTDVVTTAKAADPASGLSSAAILEGTSLRSPDGSAVFFYENFNTSTYSGDLCVSYNNGKKILIDTGVSSGLLVSSTGKVVLYAKTGVNEEGTSSISLYSYKKNGKPQLITDNYAPNIYPMLSYSAKYLAFASPDAETGTTALYVTKLSAGKPKTTKVAEDVEALHSINDSGYAFFDKTIKKDDGTTGKALSYAAPNKPVTVVAENATVREDCFGQLTRNFAFYVNMPDSAAKFYAGKTNKVPELRFEEENFYLNPDVENKNYIFITIDETDANSLTIHRMKGKKLKTVAEKVSAEGINNVLNSRDYNKITYIRNFDQETYSGEFFISKTSFGIQKETKIADGVSLAIGTPDLKYIAYFTDLDLNTGKGTLNLFNGKKSTVVAENVPYYTVTFSGDNKTLFYMTDLTDDGSKGTLKMAKTNKPSKSVDIDKDVSLVNTYEFLYSARTNGSVYYLKNYDPATGLGDLYFAKKGKNPKLVEEATSGLILE